MAECSVASSWNSGYLKIMLQGLSDSHGIWRLWSNKQPRYFPTNSYWACSWGYTLNWWWRPTVQLAWVVRSCSGNLWSTRWKCDRKKTALSSLGNRLLSLLQHRSVGQVTLGHKQLRTLRIIPTQACFSPSLGIQHRLAKNLLYCTWGLRLEHALAHCREPWESTWVLES